jgi:hypothetical protein
MFRKAVLVLLLSVSLTTLLAQYSFKPFAGAGFEMENRIGFRGINLQGGGEIYVSVHLTGIAGIDLFLSKSISK